MRRGVRTIHQEYARPASFSDELIDAHKRCTQSVERFVAEELRKLPGLETIEIARNGISASTDGYRMLYRLIGVRDVSARMFSEVANEHRLYWLDYRCKNEWVDPEHGTGAGGKRLVSANYLDADLRRFMARERALTLGNEAWKKDLKIAMVLLAFAVLVLFLLLSHWSSSDVEHPGGSSSSNNSGGVTMESAGRPLWERKVEAADVQPLTEIIDSIKDLDRAHYHSLEISVEDEDGFYFLEVDFSQGASMNLDALFALKAQLQTRMTRAQMEFVERNNKLRLGFEIKKQSTIEMARARYARVTKRVGLKRRKFAAEPID